MPMLKPSGWCGSSISVAGPVDCRPSGPRAPRAVASNHVGTWRCGTRRRWPGLTGKASQRARSRRSRRRCGRAWGSRRGRRGSSFGRASFSCGSRAAVQAGGDARGAAPGLHGPSGDSAGLADGTPVLVERCHSGVGFRSSSWRSALRGGCATPPMNGPRVGIAGSSHEASPFGPMRRLACGASCCREGGVGALVRHDVPEPLRASQGAGSELDPVLTSNEAAECSTKAAIRDDPDVGERGSVPQCAEPAENPLGASGLSRSKRLGRGPVHCSQMLAGRSPPVLMAQ